MVDKFLYTFVKTDTVYNIKNESSGKLWTSGEYKSA